MPTRIGFWSYVHADDAAEGGRIRQLSDDLREQYALISGEPIDIFVDRNSLGWGDDWRSQVDSSLATILFFIAVITPRYFLSSECRRELQEFARGAERLGVRELVLPLVYVDVPALREEASIDDAVALVKTYQWVDWRDLRFEDATSAAYRRAVATLAQRLVDANQRILAEELSADESAVESEAVGSDDGPGILDILAAGEEALPDLNETLLAIGSEIENVGNLAEQATEEMQRSNQQGNVFAARLAVSRRLAHALSSPAERILELANKYTASLYNVDGAIRTIIARTPTEVSDNPDARSAWEEFSTGITELYNVTDVAMTSIQGFVDSLAQVETMSRDLRPPLQKLRRGLTSLTEGSSMINEWKRLVDETILE